MRLFYLAKVGKYVLSSTNKRALIDTQNLRYWVINDFTFNKLMDYEKGKIENIDNDQSLKKILTMLNDNSTKQGNAVLSSVIMQSQANFLLELRSPNDNKEKQLEKLKDTIKNLAIEKIEITIVIDHNVKPLIAPIKQFSDQIVNNLNLFDSYYYIRLRISPDIFLELQDDITLLTNIDEIEIMIKDDNEFNRLFASAPKIVESLGTLYTANLVQYSDKKRLENKLSELYNHELFEKLDLIKVPLETIFNFIKNIGLKESFFLKESNFLSVLMPYIVKKNLSQQITKELVFNDVEGKFIEHNLDKSIFLSSNEPCKICILNRTCKLRPILYEGSSSCLLKDFANHALMFYDIAVESLNKRFRGKELSEKLILLDLYRKLIRTLKIIL